MTHTYHISGMSCSGCQKHVQEVLSKIKGVESVQVDLENETATIEMSEHIPIETFQKALKEDGGSYGIHPPFQ